MYSSFARPYHAQVQDPYRCWQRQQTSSFNRSPSSFGRSSDALSDADLLSATVASHPSARSSVFRNSGGSHTLQQEPDQAFWRIPKLGPIATLRLHLEQPVIFVNPHLRRSAGEDTAEWPGAAKDPMVRGQVVIDLPRSQAVKMVRVRLEGRYLIRFPGGSLEEGTTIEKTLEIRTQGKDQLLGRGEHVFEFAFSVPSVSAPFERCQYGHTFHHVRATAYSSSVFVPDLEDTSAFNITVAPHEPSKEDVEGVGTFGLDLDVGDCSEDVGIWSLRLTSPHLTPSGLVRFKFDLHDPPPGLIIHSISARIDQFFTLVSPRTHSIISKPPPQGTLLFRLDAEVDANLKATADSSARIAMSYTSPSSTSSNRGSDPLQIPMSSSTLSETISTPLSQLTAALSQLTAASHGRNSSRAQPYLSKLTDSTPWSVSHLFRLPNGDILRPSTPDPTHAGIRVNHNIVVEVIHSGGMGEGGDSQPGTPSEKIRALIVQKPVQLISCVCMLESLQLPSYAPSTSPPSGSRSSVSDQDSTSERPYSSYDPIASGSSSPPPYSPLDPRLGSKRRKGGGGLPACVCGLSLQDMKDKYLRLMPGTDFVREVPGEHRYRRDRDGEGAQASPTPNRSISK